MASTASSLASQSLPSLDELGKGFNNKEVIVRVLHFWEARNPKRNNLLMGLELLLIDQKGNVIHAFIVANRIANYESSLKPGVVYKLKKFLVLDNKSSYRVTSHKFLIQFTQQTTIVQYDQADDSIERHTFRIRSFKEFEEAVDMNQDLYDVIGKVIHINDENLKSSTSTGNRTEVHLQMKDGQVVRVTLWGSVATNLHKRIMDSGLKPVVLLATTVNPRIFRDVFHLSSTSSTRVFLDNDVEPSAEYLTWLEEDGKSVMANNFIPEVTKPETLTIDELYQFLKNDTPQNANFCCIATIVDILPQYGWNYIGCAKCPFKLSQTDTTLVCNMCKNQNAVGVLKYRVELSVCDKDNVTTFVLFDRDTAKLTGRKAADLLETTTQGEDGGDMDTHNSIPQCLIDVISRTYKFQVKVTTYNFTTSRQTFTVTRLLEEIIGGDKNPQEETVDAHQKDNNNEENKSNDKEDNDSTGKNNHKEDNDTVGSTEKQKRARRK